MSFGVKSEPFQRGFSPAPGRRLIVSLCFSFVPGEKPGEKVQGVVSSTVLWELLTATSYLLWSGATYWSAISPEIGVFDMSSEVLFLGLTGLYSISSRSSSNESDVSPTV